MSPCSMPIHNQRSQPDAARFLNGTGHENAGQSAAPETRPTQAVEQDCGIPLKSTLTNDKVPPLPPNPCANDRLQKTSSQLSRFSLPGTRIAGLGQCWSVADDCDDGSVFFGCAG